MSTSTRTYSSTEANYPILTSILRVLLSTFCNYLCIIAEKLHPRMSKFLEASDCVFLGSLSFIKMSFQIYWGQLLP